MIAFQRKNLFLASAMLWCSYLLSECNRSADTVCTPCGPNAFTEVWNRLKQCHHCEAPCREDSGLIETLPCNTSQNRICSCPSNMYCAFESSPSCQVCELLTLCKKGFGVSVPGTRNSNTKCSPCPAGTFSDIDSYDAPCIPHRNCSMGYIPGDSTHDTICTDTDAGRRPAHTIDSTSYGSPSESAETIVDPSDAPTLPGAGAASPAAVVAKNPNLPFGVIAGVVLFAVVGLAGLAFLLTSTKKLIDDIYSRSEARILRFPPQNTDSTKRRRGSRTWSSDDLSHKRVTSIFAELNTVSAKQYDQKQPDPLALSFNNNEPEQAHLLKRLGSSSCSLEFPIGPADMRKSTQDKAERSGKGSYSGTSNEATSRHDAPSLNATRSAEPSCSGHAHVNLTCIVNVCKPDHATCTPSSVEEVHGTSIDMNDHLPLSMEEGNVQMESEGLRSFEVGGTSLYTKGEGFPLSVENTEMKISDFSSHLKMR